MNRLEALKVMGEKVGEIEDFLQGDKDDKTVNIIDPSVSVEEITRCVDGCQDLIKWAKEERKREFLSDPDLYGNDETFEEEAITTLDDQLMDRGLSRGMF